MNRRRFLKWLGIGAATVAAAPKLLAEHTPEYYPEHDSPITLEKLQYAFAAASEPRGVPQGRYIYVRVAPSTMPFRVGDFVRYKVNKRGETIAYRAPKSVMKKGEGFGMAINNALPGNDTFIMISNVPTYDDMMESVVLTIDKELRKNANA